MIASGRSNEESAFLDASETGDDVFFLTSDQLVPQDTDSAVDVYDARIDGGFPGPPPRPVECEGDACQGGPGAAPAAIDTAPASATFTGPGNLTSFPTTKPTPAKTVAQTRAQKLVKALQACRKDKRHKRRSVCEGQARKRYGPVKGKAKRRRGGASGLVGPSAREGGAVSRSW